MASLYYRRWTRMYIYPAVNYLKKYDVIQPGLENFMHIANRQNPFPENKRYFKKTLSNPDQELNNKLINNLFLKYPDLKYQSISRQKYQGDNFNSYSYSFAFITEQKKLMKAGYTMHKAFEIVQSKFQQKMKRKIDQTLLSKGLAIGNRARSLLSLYQQQVEYQSRLKMLRTKRQILKYQQQLKQIDQALKRPVESGQEQQKQHYERIFQKITDQSGEQINKQFKIQKRGQMVDRIRGDFENMFSQFYETAAYKDRLRGLTDDQIKQNIMTSPSKIKRLSRQLVKYLKSKGGISVNLNNQLKMNDQINDKLKAFIYSSPTIKVAILNHLIGYGYPLHSYKRKVQMQAKDKLKHLNTIKGEELTQDAKQTIKHNKIKQLEQVVQKDIPQDNRVYRLLQSSQQRMLRLQIKYLESYIKNSDKPNETVFNKLKQVIQKFRRLKFRLQKRHKNMAHGQLAFPEHYTYDKTPDRIQDLNVQYEDLISYLRKKTQERRLKAIDQVDDNKINQMIQKQACQQTPKSEGQQNKLN